MQGFDAPPGRWRHSASLLRASEIVVFGGYHTLDERLGDVHVFDCISRRWVRPEVRRQEDGPSERASHSACVIGEELVVFGGYGGAGKSRRHFNDAFVLDCRRWSWRRLAVSGPLPAPRSRYVMMSTRLSTDTSSHQAQAVDQRIYVFGGANASESLSDVWCLELGGARAAWRLIGDASLARPQWAMSSCHVSAIPSAKVFLFGGMCGRLLESGVGVLGDGLLVFDSDTERWGSPQLASGSQLPLPRSDSSLVMDTKGSRLVLFGGWAGRWMGDLLTLDVSRLIGPPYVTTGLSPSIGPITGGTRIEVSGVDFFKADSIVVRFASQRRSIDVRGTFESSSRIVCVTPDFSSMGNVDSLDVRVSIDGDSFTTTFQVFEVFTITSAQNSLIFGPGLISGCAIKDEVSFIILARDNMSRNRRNGGDEFKATVFYLPNGELDMSAAPVPGVTVKDRGDGKYLVRYSARYPGKYVVNVEFLGTFGGKPGPIRGSGTIVEFDEFASRNNNAMAGALMIRALKEDVLFARTCAKDFADRIFVNLRDQMLSDEERIRLLIGVKECLDQIEPSRDKMQLLIDRSEAVLDFIKGQASVVASVNPLLQEAKKLWERVTNESDRVMVELVPLIQANVGKIRADIFAFQSHLSEILAELHRGEFTRYESGYELALASLDAADGVLLEQRQLMNKLVSVARVFDVLRDTSGCSGIMAESAAFVRDYRLYWDCFGRYHALLQNFRAALWTENAAAFSERAEEIMVLLRRLPRTIKATEIFAKVDGAIKEFVETCRVVSALHSPVMRER